MPICSYAREIEAGNVIKTGVLFKRKGHVPGYLLRRISLDNHYLQHSKLPDTLCRCKVWHAAKLCYRIGDLGALLYKNGGCMSIKTQKQCEWCGSLFESYPSAHRRFCCSRCFYKQASRAANPDGYKRHPHLSEYNKAVNPFRMTEAVREKLRRFHLGLGTGKSYEKLHSRHTHRVIAEQILGRKLLSCEVVHHIDGNPRNNTPDNLLVLPSQRAHILLHLQKGDLARKHAKSKRPT